MLMVPMWSCKNAMQLLMHGDTSWAGPGGWWKLRWPLSGVITGSVTKIWKAFKAWNALSLGKQAPPMQKLEDMTPTPSRLWGTLAGLSMMAFLALPLSGLVMELGDGYGFQEGGHPLVTGRDYTTLNQRWGVILQNADNWKKNVPVRIPGAGIVYTKPEVDRKQFPFLESLPVVLPTDDGVPEIFLTAQAAGPIQGRSWGMRLQYNCSVVRDRSELRILNQHMENENKTAFYNFLNITAGGSTNPLIPSTINGTTLRSDINGNFVSTTADWRMYNLTKVPSFVQLGISDSEDYFFGGLGFARSNPPKTYRKAHRYYTHSDGSRDYIHYTGKTNIMEFAHFDFLGDLPKDYPQLVANYGTVPSLSSEYTVPAGFRTRQEPMSLVGIAVTCTSMSEVGLANIDGVSSTFTDFTPSDTARFALIEESQPDSMWLPQFNALPFSFGPAAMLLEHGTPRLEIARWNDGSLEEYPILGINSNASDVPKADLKPGSKVPPQEVQKPILSAEKIRQALLQAYANYAHALMYQGSPVDLATEERRLASSYPNATFPTSENRAALSESTDNLRTSAQYLPAFINLNVTGTEQKVLIRGVLPWEVPAVLLLIWCFGSMGLVSWYGFRKRWSDTLDAFSVFRFGGEFGKEMEEGKEFDDLTGSFEKCHALKKIPGLVGNVGSSPSDGRISLVWNERGSFV